MLRLWVSGGGGLRHGRLNVGAKAQNKCVGVGVGVVWNNEEHMRDTHEGA